MHLYARRFVLLAAVAGLSACAGSFQQPADIAYYGDPPQEYEALIKTYMEGVLKDPESARYKFGRPVKAYMNNGLIYGGKVAWNGYLVDVEVNAKNSFGGYVGFKPYMILFYPGGRAVVKHFEGSSHVLIHRLE